MDDLKPCPFCGGTPELVDHRVEWFVRCNECKPFATVVFGESAHHIDHAGIDCETDEEADAACKAASDAVDWDYIRQSAIDAWNVRVDLASPKVNMSKLDALQGLAAKVEEVDIEEFEGEGARIYDCLDQPPKQG